MDVNQQEDGKQQKSQDNDLKKANEPKSIFIIICGRSEIFNLEIIQI